MSNSKISALTAATTPLAGTEVLPIVQSSATVKATIANIQAATVSAGIANAVQYLNGSKIPTTSSNFTYDGTTLTITQATAANISLNNASGNYLYVTAAGGAAYIDNRISSSMNFRSNGVFTWSIYGGAQIAAFSAAGNLTMSLGNVVQGTAAKGFDFSANTPAAGKTSTVLNWYEEGTWTPNQGAGLTLVGAFSSTGKYTRVGRNVTVSGTVTGATSVAVTAAGVITTNLPFTIGTAGHGNATNAAITASAAIICNTGTTVTAAGAIAATGTITFSATYFA
jgi:hypothetical protein